MYSLLNRFFSHAHLLRPVSINCSVAIILTREASPRLFLIERARRKGDPWSGDMAFPGGKKSPDDDSLVETARRETKEESSIVLPFVPDSLRIRDRITKSHNSPQPMTITPFVFSVDKPLPAIPNHEVASCHWVELKTLKESKRQKMLWRIGRMKIPVSYIPIGEKRLWGLTLSMVDELLILLDQQRL